MMSACDRNVLIKMSHLRVIIRSRDVLGIKNNS